MTNFEIGRRIVEHEQKGESRAEYGQELLRTLSAQLTEEFGKGFSVSNLQMMRKFYLEYVSKVPSITQTVSALLTDTEIIQKPSDELLTSWNASRKSTFPFTLSWSHCILLLTITDSDERSFYEIEASGAG